MTVTPGRLPACLALLLLPPALGLTVRVEPAVVEGKLHAQMNFSVAVVGGEGRKVHWEPTISYIAPTSNSSFSGDFNVMTDFIGSSQFLPMGSTPLCT
jgi:hypothetical protein